MNNTYVCVDLETTGILPTKNEIIEIGAVKIKNGEIIDTYQTFVCPKKFPPPFIYRLTGITKADLKPAPSFQDIHQDLLNFLEDHPFIAHSAEFDFGTINTELKRLEVPELTCPIIDTQDLALLICPDLSSHKLSNLAEHYNIHFPDKHRALSDAECTGKLFIKMIQDLQNLPPLVIREALSMLPEKKQGLRTYLAQFLTLETLANLQDYKSQIYPAQTSVLATEARQSHPTINLSQVPNLEPRPNQEKVITCIERCFTDHSHGVIEAATGIGKTIAYLIPSLNAAQKNDVPVIISTKTKHLQSQILEQEIPRLENALGAPIDAVLIKGKENYINLTRFDAIYRAAKQDQQTDFLGLLSWVLKTKTGDLTELHPNLHNKFADRVRFYPEDPPMSPKKCFHAMLKKQVKTARLIITNHAFLLTDSLRGSNVLPPTPYLICDEAHSLEDIATGIAAIEYSNPRVKHILKQLTELREKSSSPLTTDQKTRIEAAEKDIDIHHQAAIRELSTLMKKSPYNQDQSITDDTLLTVEFRDATTHIESLRSTLENAYNILKQSEEIELDIKTPMESLSDLIIDLNRLLALDAQDIHYLSASQGFKPSSIKWRSVPLNIQDSLIEALFQGRESVISLSATLKVKDSFNFFLERIGLLKANLPHETLAIESDFDYKTQANCRLPEDLPEKIYEDPQAMADYAQKIITDLNGRTLILMTAKETMNKLYTKLKSNIMKKGSPLQLLCQNKHGTRESILEKFKKFKTEAAIIGTDSFWEGVDIPGEALQAVIIPKLPFPVPSDPIHSARMAEIEKNGGNPFIDYAVPMALIKFKQGIGRLIRTKTDTGTLHILDPRIRTKPYGKFFRNELEKFNSQS